MLATLPIKSAYDAFVNTDGNFFAKTYNALNLGLAASYISIKNTSFTTRLALGALFLVGWAFFTACSGNDGGGTIAIDSFDNCSTLEEGDKVTTTAKYGQFNPEYVPNAPIEGTNYVSGQWVTFPENATCTIESKLFGDYKMTDYGSDWYRINCGYESDTGREAIGWVRQSSITEVGCAVSPLPTAALPQATEIPAVLAEVIPPTPSISQVSYVIAENDILSNMFYGYGNFSTGCIPQAIQASFGGNDVYAFNRFVANVTSQGINPDAMPIGTSINLNVPAEYVSCFGQ